MLKRIAGIFFARSIPAAGVIMLTLLAPMVLTIEGAAVFLTGITLLYLLGIISRFGLDVYLLKHSASRLRDEVKIIDRPDLIFFILGLSFSSLFLLGYLAVEACFDLTPAYAWVFYALPAFSCQGILASLLKATGDEFYGSLAEPGVSSLLAVIIFFALRVLGIVDLGAAYSYAVWFVFLLTLGCVAWGRSFVAISAVDIKSGLIESWFFLMNQLSSYFSQWYPLILLGVMDDRLAVYYAVANRMATIIIFVGVTIDSFAAPRFSNCWKLGDLVALDYFKRKVTALAMLGAVICFSCVGVVSYLYGQFQGFDLTYTMMALTLIASYATAIGLGPNGFYLIMRDEGNYVAWISISICALIFLTSTALFFIGASWGMAVVVGGAIILRSYLLYRRASLVSKQRSNVVL